MRASLLLILTAAAACTGYKPGSFTGYGKYDMAGEQRTVGCLDVAVEQATDPDAVGPVAGITVANRCDTAVTVDIGAIRATGRRPDGDVVRLRAYDPAWEIRPATLEARSVAREYIEYQAPEDLELSFSEWCLDLAALDSARPSERPVLVCFGHGVLT